MAITGAIFKSLSFDGVTSREYGVYITGEAVFNAPEREVEMISIPGRNGDFAQDKGRFQNIEVTYPAGIFADNEADFAKAISEFRNFLCSRKGYCRLTDEYNPDEYRMAVYKNGLEVDPKQLKAGKFEITFDCQPQRYLLSGEEPQDMIEWIDVETETGETVTIDALGLKSFSTPFEPSQDGTPWITDTDEVAPYLFRTMPQIGQDYDSEVLTTIIGGSVAWNQLVDYGVETYSQSGITAVSANGTITLSGTATQNVAFNSLIRSFYKNEHIFFISSGSSSGSETTYYFREGFDAVPNHFCYGTAKVYRKSTSNGSVIGQIVIKSGVNVDGVVLEPQLIDLTQMLGTTIANYIYSLEQTTAGAGVAWLRNHFPTLFDGYHAYDAGSLKSVKTSAHETVGFNQWDIQNMESGYISNNDGGARPQSNSNHTGYIEVVPNQSYYFRTDYNSGGYGAWYDCNKNFIIGFIARASSCAVQIAPSNAKYMRYTVKYEGVGNPDTVCINISGSRNGEYEPYRKRSYALDADLELRGIYKLDANNHLYCDGDIYPPSGEVERVYGYRAYQSGDESLTDAITDGTNTVYKLTTPTTETADPYQEVQIVDNYGTEAFVDTRDVQIPVGHTSRFGEVYVINGWDEIGFSVASGEDQTDYTLDLDGTRYGGEADIISGDVELTWGHTNDYNGETLSGRWLSDRDVYAEGTTPSIGAEVAYELSTPQTVQVTPVEVDLYDGENTLSSNTGKGVTVEYGTPPGMIYNPTLFDSSPLIITEGYGDIHIGSDTITLNSAVIGKVKIGDANHASHLSDTTSVTFSLSSSVDTSLLNDGDDITLDYEGVTILKAALSGMNPTGHSITSKTGIITTASTQSRGTDSVAVNSAATGITFSKGTSQTKSGQVIAKVVVNGENVTATTNISVAFNGSDTISISASISVTGYYLRINQTELGHTDVYGDSTVVVGAGERYIDLDIGEAYMIEDGQIISVDSTTALPPELPTLKPGETEITHDNTITALAVTPRWWKV